jgi:hypothetical protein
LREKVWQEEAEEARLQLVKAMAEVRLLKGELKSIETRDSNSRKAQETTPS